MKINILIIQERSYNSKERRFLPDVPSWEHENKSAVRSALQSTIYSQGATTKI